MNALWPKGVIEQETVITINKKNPKRYLVMSDERYTASLECHESLSDVLLGQIFEQSCGPKRIKKDEKTLQS